MIKFVGAALSGRPRVACGEKGVTTERHPCNIFRVLTEVVGRCVASVSRVRSVVRARL